VKEVILLRKSGWQEGKEHEVNFDSTENADLWFRHAKRIGGTKFDKKASDFVCSGVIDMQEWMESTLSKMRLAEQQSEIEHAITSFPARRPKIFSSVITSL